MVMRSGRAVREDGFTLIEMIVVLVVLALAGSIVLARGPMRSATLDLRSAGRLVATDLRTLRAQAIATDHDQAFSIDPRTGDYGVRNGARHHVSGPVTVAGPATPILFHPDGSASGGTVILAEKDRRVSVVVDWLTGGVSVR